MQFNMLSSAIKEYTGDSGAPRSALTPARELEQRPHKHIAQAVISKNEL